MSQGQGGGPPEGRGPPERKRPRRASREQGRPERINIGGDPAEIAAAAVDWDNLSPFEEWVVAVLEENDLIGEEN